MFPSNPNIGDEHTTSSGALYRFTAPGVWTNISSTSFVNLNDAPSSFVGKHGHLLSPNSSETQLEFVTKLSVAPVQSLVQGTGVTITDDGLGNFTINSTGGGSSTFLTLTDVDDSNYTGKTAYIAQVNATETGLELVPPENSGTFNFTVGNRAQVNSSTGRTYLYSDDTANGIGGSTCGDGSTGLSNGELHPLPAGEGRTITEIRIVAAAAAVNTATVGAVPNVRLDVVTINRTTAQTIASIDVPCISGQSSIAPFNNLGGGSSLIVFEAKGLNVPITNEKLWGVFFQNEGSTNQQINGLSRFYIDIFGVKS